MSEYMADELAKNSDDERRKIRQRKWQKRK